MNIIFIPAGSSKKSVPDMSDFFKSAGLLFMQGLIIFSDYSKSKEIVDYLQGKGHVRPDLGLPDHIKIHNEPDLETKIKKASAMHKLIFFIGSPSEIADVKELFPETIESIHA